jgi:hypothetical protein
MLTDAVEDIKLGDAGFYLDGIHYPFDDIDSLRFYFVRAGTDYCAELDIYLVDSERPISIRPSPLKNKLGLNRKESESTPVVNLYHEIAERTFRIRLGRYLEALENEGYFYYGNKKVYKNGIVSDDKREINLLTDRPLLKSPFKIFHPAPQTSINSFKNLFSPPQDFVINTEFDADVFFTILEHYFALKW